VEVINRSDGDGCRTSPLPAGARAEGEFERALAHKLGNLLQVVNGNLELLAQRVVDDRSRTYVANAQAAANELTDIAHSLVSVADP
jgi:hypothetical protein